MNNRYNASKDAVEQFLSGADRWFENHKNILNRLNELISIMEDPEVPEGVQIKFRNDKAFNHLRRAAESKKAQPTNT